MKATVRTPQTLFTFTPMALAGEQVIVDSSDPLALGHWWAEALGRVVVDASEEIIEIRPEPDRMPGLLFVPVPEGRTSKNRLHPDFRPDDQEAEVARLLSLGARRRDTVRDGQHWVTSSTRRATSSVSWASGGTERGRAAVREVARRFRPPAAAPAAVSPRAARTRSAPRTSAGSTGPHHANGT